MSDNYIHNAIIATPTLLLKHFNSCTSQAQPRPHTLVTIAMPTAAQLCVTVALICAAFELSVSSGIEEVCAGSLFFTMIDGRNFLDKPGSREGKSPFYRT